MGTKRNGYILQGFVADEQFNKQQAIIKYRGNRLYVSYEELRQYLLAGNSVEHAILTDNEVKMDSSYKKYNYINQTIGKWHIDEYYGVNEKNAYGFWLCTCKCGNRALVAEISLQNGESTQCNKCRLGQIMPKYREETEDWEPIEYVGQDTTQKALYALWRYRCKHCGKEAILRATKVDNKYMIPRCECLRGHSRFEDQVYAYIKNIYGGTIERNVKTIINPYEIDLYMPELKLAIECNGNYWHSDNVRPDVDYHINKTKRCLEKGVRLIHIFEYEWNTIQNKIKAYLSQQLGIAENTYFARNCELKRINNQIAYEFCDKYHLQGGVSSQESLGLYYNSELVMVATFGPQRFNTPCDAELLRLCSKAYTHIIGGASKLLTAYIRLHPNYKIVSYCNIAKFTGNIYTQLNFKYLGMSRPNYVYVDHEKVLTRYQCQKHKLVEQGFDPNLSEAEIMKQRGFNKIYDCGNAVYLYEPNSTT